MSLSKNQVRKSVRFNRGLELIADSEGLTLDSELLQAKAQLTGYIHAQKGGTLIQLITSMGLTADEWMDIRKEDWIPEDVKETIDHFFSLDII